MGEGRVPLIDESILREVVEALAPLVRAPCSQAERAAADWIASRLRKAGCHHVELEDEASWGSFPPNLIAAGLLGIAGGIAGLAGRELLAIGALLVSIVAVADEVQNGPRVLRRLLRRKRRTVNVVARVGDPDAPRTIVLMAHHDAAKTGHLFDQTLLKKIYARWPAFVHARRSAPPEWWIGVIAPAVAILGVVTGQGWLISLGIAGIVAGVALLADIERSETVPGANDNLSGVAALVAIAEELSSRPVPGLDVWIVSTGAEETLQDGIRGFMARHGEELQRRRAVTLNFETVGSPHLGLLEGEGPLWMEDYRGPWLRDTIASIAKGRGIELERGLRARSSTDSVITSRAGLPSACLVSLTDWRALANYHLRTDVPENLDYRTIANASRLGVAVAQSFGRGSLAG
ncbi:MAG: M28 family peptidase [Deltaproteobacteria bacterium]|nr:M28 family peptidase [Deltaproteobacteria bacterium]